MNEQDALRRALEYHRDGNLQEAEVAYREALEYNARCAPALHALGVLALQTGRTDEAIELLDQAVDIDPNSHEYVNNLGQALRAAGEVDEALECFRKAVELNPAYALGYHNLATTLRLKGELDQAIAAYQTAIKLKGDFLEAFYNLGNTYRDAGRLDEATAAYKKVIELNPWHSNAYTNLGNVQQAQGNLKGAIERYRRAIQLAPQNPQPHFNLGVTLRKQGDLSGAITAFRQACQLKNDFVEAYEYLGNALWDAGHYEQSMTEFNRAMEMRPTNRLRVVVSTLLPAIYKSKEEVRTSRQRLIENVRQLQEQHVKVDLARFEARSVFYLAYQGQNDRDINRDIASLYRSPVPDPQSLPRKPRPDGRIRVGFVSRLFKDHTIGLWWRGIIAHLSKEEFAVSVFSAGSYRDEIALFIQRHASHYAELPANVIAASRTIAEQDLDVLFYTDLGMDPFTYALAFARLAPVQCASLGHPVTSGIPTIDHYISSQLMEAENAQEHYTENLVKLKSLPVYYYRPTPPTERKGRDFFGLPADKHLYGCLQSLFKFHPEYDDILAGILRRDPNGLLIIPEGEYSRWNQMLLARFAQTMPDVVERVRFIPHVSRSDFLNLNACMDAILVPTHFGAGNSSFDAFAVGAPSVTMPTPYLRGRITYGLYKAMGVMDCVAETPEQYVDIAVRLGTDRDFRQSVRAKILANSHALYENMATVRELEEFFRKAVGGRQS